MMFILKNPGMALLQNQLRQQQDKFVPFPPSEIIRRNKDPTRTARDVYVQVAMKIFFLFSKLSDKHILYFISNKSSHFTSL